nr:PepSY domain-containing protein [uncultured Kingella sp.]
MKLTNKTAAVIFAAVFATISAPALADGDYLHYEKNRASYITHEKAAQIAVAKVGGGQATDVEFDRSRNKPDHFDVDVRMANGQKYEVKVDAKTGAVLSSHLDD